MLICILQQRPQIISYYPDMSSNRLEQCISDHVAMLDTENMSSEVTSQLQNVLRTRLVHESEQLIHDWLDRVSVAYTIERPFLEREWSQFIRVSKKHKVDDDMETDETLSKKSKTLPHPQDEDTEVRHTHKSLRYITRFHADIGHFVHEDTGMVFISSEQPHVFGRIDEEGVVQPLTQEDIEICNIFRFIHAVEMYEPCLDEFMRRSSSTAESSSLLDQS